MTLAVGGPAWLNERGGGLNLSLLYSTLLDRVGDEGRVTVEGGVEAITVPLANQFARIEHLYGKGRDDAVAACVQDALGHLVRRRILRECGADWLQGPAFKFGVAMIVVPGHKPTGVPTIRHTVVSRGERDRLARAEQDRQAIAAAAARLKPDGPGLRPIEAQHVEALLRSVQEFGLRDDLHPVLEDQHNRILSGRHRLEVEKRLDRPWRRKTIRVRNDDEALAIAWAANSGKAWAPADRARLAKLGIDPQRAIGTSAKRELIEQELRAEPSRRNRQIAAPLGVSHHTVQAVRDELEENGQIAHFDFEPGRPRADEAPSPAPPAAVRGGARAPGPPAPPWWPITNGRPVRPAISPNARVTVRNWIANGITREYGEAIKAAIDEAFDEGVW